MSERELMLELDGVVAGYGETIVLRDVSVSVARGEVVALLGPNGAGKTTLLRTAAGLVRPERGAIRFAGEDVTTRSIQHRARGGLCGIPEGRAIFPSLTVKDNIRLFSPRRKERESAERALEVFPMFANRLNQMAGSLSGGQQQILAMVRAYIAEPRLVLVDEASLGLAPVVVDQIFEFMASIAADGTSLLIVEQYVTRALDLASSVYILNNGAIVHAGPASDLRGQDLFREYLGIDTVA